MLSVRSWKQNMTIKALGITAMPVNTAIFAGFDFNVDADFMGTVNGKPPELGRFSYSFRHFPL